MRSLYIALHYLLLPFIMLRMAWRGQRNRGYWERWGERFGFVPVIGGRDPTLWIHAVSVGEVQAAIPVVRALKARLKDARIVLTTTTPTGRVRVAQALGDSVLHRYAPYDLPGPVRRFLDRVRPSLVIIMETELWPNILHMCSERGIPVLLANVRLSERSAAGYRRVASAVKRMLSGVTLIAAQTREDAERIVALGAEPDKVHVTGSIKFDVKLPASLSEEAQVMRRCFGVDRGVWIAASTHEGEEEQVLDAYREVLTRVPDCLLVLVPRHPERCPDVVALCRKRGLTAAVRTDAPASCAGKDVFIGNTMGELPLFYAASDVAFVGGSLVKEEGHNMLEPAALGVPVVFGPYVADFAEISARLREAGAATQVTDASELAAAVTEYLSDGNLRHNAGERGRLFVEQNRGALDVFMALVERLIDGARVAETPALEMPSRGGRG